MKSAEEWMKQLNNTAAEQRLPVVKAMLADALRHAAWIIENVRSGNRLKGTASLICHARILSEAKKLEAK